MPSNNIPFISSDISDPIIAPLQELWSVIISVLPQVTIAVLVFLIGWLIALTLGSLAAKLINKLHVDELAEKTGVKTLFNKVNINLNFSAILGWSVKWFFVLVFLIAAADILGWTEITDFLRQIALYLPNVMVAVIILAIGLAISNFVHTLIKKGLAATEFNETSLASAGKIAVIVFAVFAALSQLGIAARLIEILFAGVVFSLALAFGLGGREKASEIINKVSHKVNN